MGVAAASNTFNLFNTGRLLLKAAKKLQLAALQLQTPRK